MGSKALFVVGWVTLVMAVAGFLSGAWSWFALIGLWVIASAAFAARGVLQKRAKTWRGRTPHLHPLIYLDAPMAVRPTILGHQPTDGYRLACLFFGVGLIDRTRTQRSTFPVQVLDPIPTPETDPSRIPDFAALCRTRAEEIVTRARREQRQIHLLWSGGIDSTTACVSLIDALDGESGRLEIFETAKSHREYRHFSRRILARSYKRHRIKSAGDAYRGNGLVVTGEFGDQIFGSAKALTQTTAQLRAPWATGLKRMLREQLGSEARAEIAFGYLSRQIAAAPVPIPDLFTCLWWINFSMKWQAVDLRMFTATEGLSLAAYRDRTAHFFGTPAFQLWALANPGQGLKDDWASYKWPARDVIYAHTQDAKYVATKTKEPSLRGMLGTAGRGLAVAIDARGTRLYQPIDRTLRDQGAVAPETDDEDEGFTVEFSVSRRSRRDDDERPKRADEPDYDPKRENPLWEDMGDGE